MHCTVLHISPLQMTALPCIIFRHTAPHCIVLCIIQWLTLLLLQTAITRYLPVMTSSTCNWTKSSAHHHLLIRTSLTTLLKTYYLCDFTSLRTLINVLHPHILLMLCCVMPCYSFLCCDFRFSMRPIRMTGRVEASLKGQVQGTSRFVMVLKRGKDTS